MIELLMRAYEGFNHRDIDAVLELTQPDVHWPNGMEGGWVDGHDAVREYWTRQWQTIDPLVIPITLKTLPDGRVEVLVRQVVKDMAGNLLSDSVVAHVYSFRDGLVSQMDIEEPPEAS